MLTLVVGLPIGILMAASRRLRNVLEPVLDVMQTLPTFVYLIPVLMLFGLGKVPALLATVIYALPPLVRLTDLGIRQVDPRHRRSRAFVWHHAAWQMLLSGAACRSRAPASWRA